jgi:transcriptional regulator GlxA family with amidase domain
MGTTRNVAIYVFDQVEVLDFAGPFEVFSTASRVYSRLHPKAGKPFDVFTIAAQMGVVTARGDLLVEPKFRISNHPAIDVLVVPGGVIEEELEREAVIRWIQSIAQSSVVTASVCTGAFLLAKAGLLSGKSAITHWEDVDTFETMFPDIQVDRTARWVDEGRVVTSAGISAGIDMSLHLVSRLEGIELARLTARQMEYRWIE